MFVLLVLVSGSRTAPETCAAGLNTRHSLTLDGSTWLFATHATKASFSRMCLHALSSFQRTGSPDVSQTPVLLLRAVLPDQRTRCRVRLIGVPTERPFPSVLGEPSKVTTAPCLGQPFFRCSRKQPGNESGSVKTGGGREHLGCSPPDSPGRLCLPSCDWPSGFGARQANLPILRLEFPACQHPRTLSAHSSYRVSPTRVGLPQQTAKKSLPIFHSGAARCVPASTETA